MRMRTAHFLTAAKRIVTLAFFLGFVSLSAVGQCDCPEVDTCAPCGGGLKGITLRYTGGTAGSVVVSDQLGVVYSGPVNPGDTFSFSGSIPNDKFAGNDVTVVLNSVPNATIGVNCNSLILGGTYGSFTLVAASSKTGGPVCCSSSMLENIPPVISNCPEDLVVILPSDRCSPPVNWTEPTASDNCGVQSVVGTHQPGATFPVGSTVVSYTATDLYGNTSTCTFTVTISDNSLPVITSCPEDIMITLETGCNSAVTWSEPTATDNCSVVLTSTHSPGALFPIGVTPVTYTATDPSGNSTECSFLVIIEQSGPQISGCPDEILIRADNSGFAAANWDEPQGSAACGQLSLTRSHQPGDEFPIGSTIVTYQFTNDQGESSVCSFPVVVSEADLAIVASKVITPDGNGVNDFWQIENIEKYRDNSVMVFDRWGSTIYHEQGYDNEQVAWWGTTTNGTRVPTGTYFYTIEVRLTREVITLRGFLELVR